jgi:S-(hydroxymethyl)glutathione dehydrogenase / alcohol dehydrogenase
MIKNKLAVLKKINSPLKIVDDILLPNLKKNQVLVKVHYTAICGSQLYEIKGLRESKKYIPHALGHEATGVVISKHKSVKKIKKNDKIFVSWIKSSGGESASPKYFFPNSKKKINCGKVATFSKYCIVPENRVNKIPKELSMKESVLLGCAIPTGAGMVINQSKIKKNNRILVIGVGGVGICSLMALKLKKDILIDVYDKNKKTYLVLKKFFNNINLLSNKEFQYLEKKISSKLFSGYDYIFETTGNTKVLQKSIYFLKDKGKVIFASHPAKNSFIEIDPFELIKGKQINGSWGGNTIFKKNIKNFVKIIKENKNLINFIANNTIEFNKINRAIVLMKKKYIIRPIIKVS